MLAIANSTYPSPANSIDEKSIFKHNVSENVVFKAPVNFDIRTFKEQVNGSTKTYNIYNSNYSKKRRARRIAYFYIIVKGLF